MRETHLANDRCLKACSAVLDLLERKALLGRVSYGSAGGRVKWDSTQPIMGVGA